MMYQGVLGTFFFTVTDAEVATCLLYTSIPVYYPVHPVGRHFEGTHL